MAKKIKPPKRTDKPEEEVSLTGMVFAVLGQDGAAIQPALLTVPGSDALYLPVFDDVKKLVEAMIYSKTRYSNIKHIDDGAEFLESLPMKIGEKDLKVMLNPYFTPMGKVRWVEVQR